MGTDSLPLESDELRKTFGDFGNAVRYLSRCARAVVGAHLDSLNEKPYWVRAPRELLESHLRVEFPEETADSSEQLQASLDLFSRGLGGVTLERREKWVWLKPDFKPFERKLRFIPTVFQLVQSIVGHSIPRPVLFDFYRMELRERFKVNDSPTFIRFALEWLDNFNRIVKRELEMTELLELVPGPGADKDSALCLIELFGFLRLLWPQVLPVGPKPAKIRSIRPYRIYHAADPAFVLSNLFGHSTGVTGLDYLFYGGVWGPGGEQGQENPSIVISGGPGLGKSTLAVALAAQVAARGGLALYLHFQLDSRTIVRQAVQFYRPLLPFFRLIMADEPGVECSEIGGPGGGRLVVSSMPTSTHEMITAALERLITKHDSLEGADVPSEERLVVFDSISACEGYGVPVSDWRRFLEGLTIELRARGYSVIFLVEQTHATTMASNIILRTSISVSAQPPRTVICCGRCHIAKSRWQACHRGDHAYTIRADEGIRVYPASAAIITVSWKREPHIRLTSAPEPIDPGIVDFDTFLARSPTGTDKGDSSNLSWWVRGSVTALIGPRGTLKTEFGLAFCQAEGIPKSDKDGHHEMSSSLFLHLAAESRGACGEQMFSRKTSRPTPFGGRYDIPFTGRQRNIGAVVHLFFKSGYLGPGQVIQVISDLITEKRDAGVPIRRAVIADAGNILPDFPVLKNDPAFIPALSNLLASQGITTLIIYSRPEHGGPDHIIDQVRSTTQNIIQCDRIFYGGQLRVALSVSRSFDETHDRGIYELEKTSEHDRPRKTGEHDRPQKTGEHDRPQKPANTIGLCTSSTRSTWCSMPSPAPPSRRKSS